MHRSSETCWCVWSDDDLLQDSQSGSWAPLGAHHLLHVKTIRGVELLDEVGFAGHCKFIVPASVRPNRMEVASTLHPEREATDGFEVHGVTATLVVRQIEGRANRPAASRSPSHTMI